MDNSNTWDKNFQQVFALFKNAEKIQNRQLNTWFQLWNRAYKDNRMKNPTHIEKWNILLEVQKFNSNLIAYESYLKSGIKPCESSNDKKEKSLALWFNEQNEPSKCLDTIKIDMLKTTYSQLF
jgi:hypothetical protein